MLLKTGRIFLLIAVCLIMIAPGAGYAQQVADTLYTAPLLEGVDGRGTIVVIDEAHHNFHTVEGRYAPFAKVLRGSGFTVKKGTQPFSASSLKEADILVIANAVNELNLSQWKLPTPSAFTKEEIRVVNEWVKSGGSLFLVADHMPFAGAAADLAGSFGFTFYNGFVVDTSVENKFADVFTLADKSLIIAGISTGRMDSIATFTGQAFDIPKGATSILTFDGRYKVLLPETAWVFDKATPEVPAAGKSQGAILKYGKGRVAVFGEAAMFTAQVSGGVKAGMNSQAGRNNYKLLLAIVNWLKG